MTLRQRCTHSLSLCSLCQYYIILSVNFEPLCIGPIMIVSAVGGDRKGEIEQSPKKKKFKDSTISKEDLDNAIANGIKLAFKEQQSTLDSIVTSAVRDAVDSVLIPALRELREDIQATNNFVKELRTEIEAIATVAKQTCDQVDSVQAAAHEDRRTVTDLGNQLERLTEKMTDMEDRSRRNNVRLVGLPEGAEGSNVAGFLRVNLSKWIPSLRDRNIEIDRAHRVYDGRKNSDRPRTLIFRVLRWHDRSEILRGARQAYPVKCMQDNVTLLFFPDFSPATTIRRKVFNPRRWQRLVSSPSSPIRRQLNYGTRVSRKVSTLLRKRRIWGITWPFDSNARIVFCSAHFVNIILSCQ